MQERRYVLRFVLLIIFLILCLIGFSVKLVLIQVFKSSHLANLAERQHKHLVEIEAIRGAIFDQKLRPLAFNVSAYSLYANPKDMSKEEKLDAVNKLSQVLKIDRNDLNTKLSKDKHFVWIKRKLDKDLTDRVKELNLKGFGFKKESRRYYPNGFLASHIIGFADTDNRGLEGLELAYNKELQGESGWEKILKDAKQRQLMFDDQIILPKDGLNLVLTIDETIQYITEKALTKAYEKFKAKGATAIVLNVKTGEILALANAPTYDLSNIAASKVEQRTNRAISFVYEPGSVFKIVIATAALEEEAFKESDVIFCENGKYRVANHILKDHHPNGNLTFRGVFEQSSNIGVCKIAQKIGGDKLYKYAKRFGFGSLTNIDLKGEVSGLLKPTSRWSKTSISAIPMGQEVTVTPIQLVSALAVIGNDGILMKPYVVKRIEDNFGQVIRLNEPEIIDRVMSEETARRVKDILVGVVESGTGKNAMIKGIKIAGKTGTAQKVVDRQYSHTHFNATFYGFAPADDPLIAVIVVVDDPAYPNIYGGTVAAPAFKEIVESTLKYLNVNPSE